MLFWMRRQAASVKGELQAAVDRAMASGGTWGLAVLAFTAVIREGLETSIFMVGLATSDRSEAGWILPWEGENKTAATEGKLEGPLKTVEYQGKVYGIPFTSNTQLLWYRKDKVDPRGDDLTWDEMIDDAVAKKTHVEVQARQYEGLTVWVNALIAGAGGQIVDQQGNVKVDDTAKTAAEIIPSARPTRSQMTEAIVAPTTTPRFDRAVTKPNDRPRRPPSVATVSSANHDAVAAARPPPEMTATA